MNTADHLKLGEALAPLRNENIMIIGSGHTTHNSSMDRPTPAWYIQFQKWFNDTMTNTKYSREERKQRLLVSQDQPGFRDAHPTPEHYLPVVVMSAAAGYAPGRIMYEETILGSLIVSHLRFD